MSVRKKNDLSEISFLSIVIPSYKQQRTIVKDVSNIKKVLDSLPYDYEIIVVIDGKNDETDERIRKMRSAKVKAVSYEKNQGKGFAVKHGVMMAKGDRIGFIDAGMDLDPSLITLMIDLMNWNDADIIIGSKLHPESKVRYPFSRKILSWGYRTTTHFLFGFDVRDTQVGLKLFKAKVAKDVFSKIIVKRFAFDIEVLAVAYALGYKKIFEAPIKLDFKNATSITSSNFWKVIFWMLVDTSAVFYRLRILNYYSKKK